MQFSSASELVQYVNNYLDGLVGKPPSSVDEARERLKKMSEMRSEMEAFHFKNPRFAVMELMRILYSEMPGMDRETLREVVPHLKAVRYMFDVRRWTYERMRAAFLANRAAMRLLSWGIAEELIPYLPYGGEYLAALEAIGTTAFLVHRELADEISAAVRDSLSVGVLASAVVRRAYDLCRAEIAEKEKEIPDYDRVREYEKTLRKYDPEKMRDNPVLFFRMLQELEENGFLVDGDVDPALVEGLRKIRKIRHSVLGNTSRGVLRSFLLAYYLALPKRTRRNEPVLPGFPSDAEGFTAFLSTCERRACGFRDTLEGVVKADARALGAAVYAEVCGVDASEAAALTGANAGTVDALRGPVRNALEGGRAGEFLRHLGGKGGS